MSLPKMAFLVIAICLQDALCSSLPAAEEVFKQKSSPKRILLLGQKADSHPKSTHEYRPGIRIIARLLQDREGLQVIVVQADGPWIEGPELLDGADAVLVFLTEGAKWISDDPDRLAAFQRLAKRGGGLSCLHWGMGTRDAAPIQNFVQLFGGCHGGPDRKYKVDDYDLTPPSSLHPIMSGIPRFTIHEELYYNLKFPQSSEGHTALLQTRVDDTMQTVAWAWERPETGRSFGFTGLHFHENWSRLEYRRLVVQGVLWTVHQSIPVDGLSLNLTAAELALPDNPRQ